MQTFGLGDDLERADLLRKRIGVELQLVPFACRLRVGKIAHHLDDVGMVSLMERERGLGVRFRGIEAEVLPETEWRPIDLAALEREIDALFRTQAFTGRSYGASAAPIRNCRRNMTR